MNGAQGVLLSERTVYAMSLWIFGLGALILALVIVFALALLFSARWNSTKSLNHFERYLDHFLMHSSNRRDVAYLGAAITTAYAEYLSRRNEFWVTYGQTTVAVLLLIVVTVLLLTKTINPDAGLPILSGIAGFAIAKTTSSPRGLSAPPPE
ncbi:MAG: hypothetical protein ACRD4I_00725, partial [Candidatus Angelobacter sp.]